ncbi:CAAX geranylgeranyltransferase alpha subunit [Xylographa trunciseda]|nr:CAAX geranylgeranyltransferase alpha subunit [Xylographa trunciseda]
MGEYEDAAEWSDVVPIPQDDGGPNALAVIAYTDEYSEAMSYLRAVMAMDEKSERALGLTEHIISMNPAHYTVWLYRADVLRALNHDPAQELEWLNKISLKHLKNYQIWSVRPSYHLCPQPIHHRPPANPYPSPYRNHRQTIMSQLSTLPPLELSFLSRMLAKDAKNYHVFSYRQWLVAHFGLWSTNPASTELRFVDGLLRADLRNNSAWHHRWFVVFADPSAPAAAAVPAATCQRELAFATAKIREAPQNQAAWNYLKGVLRKSGRGLGALAGFAEEFAGERGGQVRSSHALDFVAEMWGQGGPEEKRKAERVLGLLADTYDPIRKNYWDYRKRLLGVGQA